jgi:hypothetical protein
MTTPAPSIRGDSVRDLTHPNRLPPPPPSAAIAPTILALASTGFTKVGVARHFNIDVRTLDRWFEEDVKLAEAFKVGRDQERQSLHNVLYKQAIEKGNIVAAMFLLKSRHGYREGDQSEQSNRVAITFNLPGAMTPDQYRTIEAIATPKPKVNPNAD